MKQSKKKQGKERKKQRRKTVGKREIEIRKLARNGKHLFHFSTTNLLHVI